jgi:AcrR family transcriptional regulator
MRADARRNRRLLLDAGCRVLVEAGMDAPLEEIARRAGLGIATLYRHFPDRGALVRGVAIDVMSRTLDEARRALADGSDAFAALRRYMHAALDVGAPAIMPLLDDETRGHPELRTLLDTTAGAQSELIAAAAGEGTLRAGVQFSDVGLALARFSRPIGHQFDPALESDVAHRHLDVFIDGLHERSGPPLSGPALTLQHLRRMQRGGRRGRRAAPRKPD